MLVQTSSRLLLAGAVLSVMGASTSTALTLPAAPVVPPDAAVQDASAAGPTAGPTAEPLPRPVDGEQIAALAAPQPARPAPHPKPRTQPKISTTTPGSQSAQGLTERDWERLPASLRREVRFACDNGYLAGPHCEHA